MKSAMCLAAGCFASAVAAAQGAVWTIDDDGPADFADVNTAQAVVASGDVLLVQPGTYPKFQLTKQLTVLGPATGAAPRFSLLSTIDNVPGFVLAGLEFDRLKVSNVPGRGTIDDCRFAPIAADVALTFENGTDLVVSRTVVHSLESSTYTVADPAVSVANSNVVFVGGEILAGNGSFVFLGEGQDAIRVQSSTLILAATRVQGGNGGHLAFCTTCGDPGGDALACNGSTVVVRGAAAGLLSPGLGTGGDPSGFGISATSCVLVYSGIGQPTSMTIGTTVYQPEPPEPFLVIEGSDLPGEARRLKVHGPAGAHGLVGVSLAPAHLDLAFLEGSLWIDPLQLVQVLAVVTQGQTAPTTHLWTVPPLAGLEGSTLWVQGVFPGVPGTLQPSAMMLTNSASLVLRF